ncbi:MAG: L-threonylcarbamoyladenylate synthase [Porphyromonas sp.]|nr:L-threonylcarbamoyladenylate synthase [Porphyromonas sp.]
MSTVDFRQDLDTALRVLRSGGIILYPTDTVWGIGCDASNAEAVARIYALKRRADSKSMLVLVDSLAMLERYVPEIPEVAYSLIEFATRPLTIIYDEALGLAQNLVAEDGSIGVRVTSEDFSAQLCHALRRPLVSTSANISGEPTPAIFSGISPEIIAGVDYVVQYRQNDKSKSAPSQIIKLGKTGEVKIIRP